MDSKTTNTRLKRNAAFTLVEVVVASGLGMIAMGVVSVLSVYSSRCFVAVTNYVSMDQSSQLALDKMSREIRQGLRLTDFSPTSLTIQDADNNQVKFVYDSGARSLFRVSAGQTN